MKPNIVLIGPGRVGSAVAKRLHDAGYPLAAIISRDLARAEDAACFIGCEQRIASIDLNCARQGDVILLAVPDDQIDPLAKKLQKEILLQEKSTLIHFSGLKPAESMRVEGSKAISISIHPLLSFADRNMAAERLTDCPCAIEGDESCLPLAEELVAAIGGRPFILPSEAKAIYHAAACITSNYLVSLTACARDLLSHCGFDKQQAMELLLPIHQATSDNLSHLLPEEALTGPIVRGDSGTVERHLIALGDQAPQLLDLYRCLGQQTVKLATESGRLPGEQADKLMQILAPQGKDHSEEN